MLRHRQPLLHVASMMYGNKDLRGLSQNDARDPELQKRGREPWLKWLGFRRQMQADSTLGECEWRYQTFELLQLE